MNAFQTAMQAYATANLYNTQLDQSNTRAAIMMLANNAGSALAPSLGVSLNSRSSSLSGLKFGDAFTPQAPKSAPSRGSAFFGSTKADPLALNPNATIAKVQQEEKRLNILQMISSVFERIYATMLKAIGRKPDASSNKQDGPNE